IKTSTDVLEYAIPLGDMDNHEAEFHAVLKALAICTEKFPLDILSFRSDSKTVVDAIEKNFTKNKTFKPLLAAIREKSATFPFFFIKWIPSRQNTHADRLARKAIRKN